MFIVRVGLAGGGILVLFADVEIVPTIDATGLAADQF
jgi:hypothetical protein